MNLPSITSKQQEIVRLLYKYRFLERKQIQSFLGHTDKSRTIRWLKDLKEKQYVEWIYDSDSSNERSKPAIYFLNINGIRYLRRHGSFPEDALRMRYKDETRQSDFIDQCLLLAECSLHLEARNRASGDESRYDYALESDYTDPGSDFCYLSDSEFIRPNLVFTKHTNMADGPTDQTYFLQLFSSSTPRYMVKKRVRDFIEYIQTNEWEDNHGDQNWPIFLVACPTLAELISGKRFTKRQLNDVYDDEIPEEVVIRFTTADKLRSKGLTAIIWEDV